MAARKVSDRNTVRVQVSMLPADLADFEALALREAEPGFAENKSATFRRMLRFYLDAEDRGELARQQDLRR